MFNVFEYNDADEWNSLVNTDKSASAYHLWEWGATLSQTYGYKKHYFVSSRDNHIDAAFPLIHVKSMLFGNRLISLPFCEYGGIVLRAGLKPDEVNQAVKSLLEATDELTRTLGAEYIEIREPMALTSVFRRNGYKQSREYATFRIDLTKGTKQLWACLDKKTRNAIRKAKKSELELEDAKGSEQLNAYYRLYLQTQKRLGSPPNCYELFRNLSNACLPSGKIRIILAKHRGRPVAGIIVFLQGKTIYWWNNVSDDVYRSLNPTNLLLWNTIEWGAENGYQSMDMGRTRRDTTIYHFKSGWGGQEVILHDYVRFLNSKQKQLQDPSQRKYQYLSKAWSFLPTSISRKLGPRIISGIAL